MSRIAYFPYLATVTALSCFACGDTNDDSDTDNLICTDDDTFTIEQCPDSYPELECTVYVDGDVESSGDGWSWDSPVKTVQEGVDLARCGAVVAGVCEQWEVWVKKGTYYIHKGCREHTVRMREQTALLGGFDGTETESYQRDWEENKTTLNGHDSAGQYQVYHVVIAASYAVIDGFTVTGGRADYDDTGESMHSWGGGLLGQFVSPTISNCVFENNFAFFGGGVELGGGTGPETIVISHCVLKDNVASKGGALLIYDNSATLSDCEMTDNFTTREGGGATFSSSEILIERSDFTGNTGGQIGGGLTAYNSNIAVIETELTENIASSGGAVYLQNSLLTIENSDVLDNSAYEGWGGGINVNMNASLLIHNSRISRNQAYGGGGGVFGFASSIDAESTVLEGNSAQLGGGVYNNTSEAVFLNSIFSSNTAALVSNTTEEEEGTGGGVHSAGATTSLVNCTFFGNTAELGGNAVYSTPYSDPHNYDEYIEDFTDITNTILWQDGEAEIEWVDKEPIITYSNIQGGFPGDGNLNADPLFVDPGAEDFHLQSTSPCIGAADPKAAPKLDMDGNPRDDEPDMGVYEF